MENNYIRISCKVLSDRIIEVQYSESIGLTRRKLSEIERGKKLAVAKLGSKNRKRLLLQTIKSGSCPNEGERQLLQRKAAAAQKESGSCSKAG
jgi:hypothetical protein